MGQVVFNTPSNRDLYHTDYKNFAPRIGFAYQLMPKLVMRGGYGVFYPISFRGGGPAPGFNAVTPFVGSLNGGLNPDATLSNAYPSGLVPETGSSLGGLTNVGFGVSTVFPNRKATYVQQWTYGFQFAPTPNDVLDVTYVGNHGTHMIASGSTPTNWIQSTSPWAMRWRLSFRTHSLTPLPKVAAVLITQPLRKDNCFFRTRSSAVSRRTRIRWAFQTTTPWK